MSSAVRCWRATRQTTARPAPGSMTNDGVTRMRWPDATAAGGWSRDRLGRGDVVGGHARDRHEDEGARPRDVELLQRGDDDRVPPRRLRLRRPHAAEQRARRVGDDVAVADERGERVVGDRHRERRRAARRRPQVLLGDAREDAPGDLGGARDRADAEGGRRRDAVLRLDGGAGERERDRLGRLHLVLGEGGEREEHLVVGACASPSPSTARRARCCSSRRRPTMWRRATRASPPSARTGPRTRCRRGRRTARTRIPILSTKASPVSGRSACSWRSSAARPRRRS